MDSSLNVLQIPPIILKPKVNLITKIKVKLDINSSTGLSRNVSEDLISLQSCLDKHSTLFKLELIQSAFSFVLSSRY